MKKPTDAAAHTEATRDPLRPLSPDSAALDSGRFLALYEMGQQLLEQREPVQVLRTIHEAIVRHLQPDRAALLAVSSDGSCRPLFAHGLDLSPPPDQWPVSWTVIRQVLDGGLAVLASDVRANPQLEDAESIQRFRIRSLMCVPLGEPVRGLAYLDNRSARPFTAADLEFLTAAARYASLVLRSAEEHRETSEALRLSDERVEMMQGELLRHEIVGAAPSLLRAYDALRRLARSGARVLLRGETGTGKELFARAYAANSPRPGSAYVPVPIPALAPTVVESELFGHVRGSFTEAVRDKKGRLELADRGVLFLDEVGEMSPTVQAKFLRVLQERELQRLGSARTVKADVRVLAATNRDPRQAMEKGLLREDLYYRLSVFEIRLPALRERPEDIEVLVEAFLDEIARGVGRPAAGLSEEARDQLLAHHWPGNVRELRNAVERAVILCDGGLVTKEHLPITVVARAGARSTVAPDSFPAEGVKLDAVERDLLEKAMAGARNNKSRAAKLLGVSRGQLYSLLRRHGLTDARR